MLPAGAEAENLSPTEKTLLLLLRRKLDEVRESFSSWLLNGDHEDARIATRLESDGEFDVEDAIHTVITTSIMRGVASFDHALATGNTESAELARDQLEIAGKAASELHAVSHWWTAVAAAHLIDELWQLSLHKQIPALDSDDAAHDRWADLRRSYIQRLRAGKRSAIELWPSQLEAARRAIDVDDDLVVALPTSAGKTRIAELCILRSLANEQRVIYVTPLRALSAQVERDLAETFVPLGFTVSALYGSAGIETVDTEVLRDSAIVVSTPEKLDFALRSDPAIIDDVGLIVLDEGHMLGPNEREVRYEALVQRLLRREDSSHRRIVCLSALFPSPEEMTDLVGWIRQDAPGDPIHSRWRPTRQRFGVLQWVTDAARLDVKVEGENPFVPRFIEAKPPPKGRRTKPFPNNKHELTLATAWRFVEQDKEVLIYCAMRKSVEPLGKVLLDCGKRGILKPLREMNERVRNAIATGTEWLGAEHPAVRCLEYGVALHHGGLPRPFLHEVERLLREGDCRVTIASPTLAQGLNLSASVLLIPSIWRNQEVIPAVEFANVSGRAGRAFVDVEGLVLHVVWEDTPRDTAKAIRKWETLVRDAKAPRVESGLLLLAIKIFRQIAKVGELDSTGVLDYITGNMNAWDVTAGDATKHDFTIEDWDRDLASLDSAVLALLDTDIDSASLEESLNTVLEGSLFTRQLAQRNERAQGLVKGFVTARAQFIWSKSESRQRRGYHAAGVGLRAGQFLDANIDRLVILLTLAEGAISSADSDTAGDLIVEFAELIQEIPPFRPPAGIPPRWKEALHAWIGGLPAADVIGICEDGGVDYLQESFAYRLPWAMEAVRVHATAIGQEYADGISGLAALAVENGSANGSVITLLRNGLTSREAAIAAIESTGASFHRRSLMRSWLRSPSVRAKSKDESWPTARSRHSWLRFYNVELKDRLHEWTRMEQQFAVDWSSTAPAAGSPVVLHSDELTPGLVLSPDYKLLGTLKTEPDRPYRDIVNAYVSEPGDTITVEYFGPEPEF
jgi:superfamily II DNA/RNA helicase